jgi:hypothetical protein
MANHRQGKIARLSFELRSKVNEMLRDGVAYKAIIDFLDKNEVRGITDNNISNWKDGGHQEWLKDQARIDEIRARSEASLELVRQLNSEKTHIVDANQMVLASKISEVLNDVDETALKALIAIDPKRFFQLAALVNSQTGERTKREKLELEVRKYQDAIEKATTELQKLRDPKKDLDDSERGAILDKVDEILGLK